MKFIVWCIWVVSKQLENLKKNHSCITKIMFPVTIICALNYDLLTFLFNFRNYKSIRKHEKTQCFEPNFQQFCNCLYWTQEWRLTSDRKKCYWKLHMSLRKVSWLIYLRLIFYAIPFSVFRFQKNCGAYNYYKTYFLIKAISNWFKIVFSIKMQVKCLNKAV